MGISSEYYLFSENYLIYLEKEYDPTLNEYIKDNIWEIKQACSKHGYNFAYIPDILEQLTWNCGGFLTYNFPTASPKSAYVPADKLYSNMIQRLGLYAQMSCPILVQLDSNFSDIQVHKIPSTRALIDLLDNLCPDRPKRNGYFNGETMSGRAKTAVASCELILCEDDDDEEEEIARIIRENVARLRQLGVGEDFIQTLLNIEEELSSLTISPDGDIYLPKYHKEITFPPLSKAIYILYLNHPEGISYDDLQNHREELLDIYKSLSLREDWEEVVRSIDELVDPMSNSINEKVSRIKRAFVMNISDNIARNYYISGPRGGAKRIPLDRSLVRMDALRY